MKQNGTLHIISSVFKKTQGEDNNKLYRSARKVFMTQFLVILAVCIITVTACFFFFANSIIKTNSENQIEAYQMSIHTISDSLDTLISVCLDDTVRSVRNSTTLIHMSLLSSEPNFYGMTFTRAKTDLAASISGIGVFSEAILYVPSADICVSSSGMNGDLHSISSKHRSIITDYLDSRADFSRMSSMYFDYVYYVCDSSLIISHEVYSFEGRPLSVLFLVLDMENITAFLNEIIDTDNPDISMNIRDHSGRLLWGEEEIKKENIITETPTFLHWQFTIGVSRQAILDSTSRALSHSIAFALALVVSIALINLFITAYLFRPMYNVAEALKKTGISADTPSEAIGKISSYQSEISFAIKTISPNVLDKLFSDLIKGEPLTLTYVENTLKSTDSGFIISAPYLCFSIENKTTGVSDNEILARLKNKCLHLCDIYGLSGYLLNIEEKHIAFVIQFNNQEITLIEAKKTAQTLMEELKSNEYTVSMGHVYHSVLDIGLSYHEACNTQKNDSGDRGIEFRIKQMLNWYVEDFTDEAESKKEIIISEIAKGDDVRENSCEAVKILMEAIGSYEFINASEIPDEYNRITLENITADTAEKILTSAFDSIIESFMSQIHKQKNPYIVQARKFIAENYADNSLSQTITAEALGISTNYLSRLFVSSLGISYVEYVTRYRLEQSMKHLLDTNEPIISIAKKCGFSSDRNFNYSFNKYVGTSPGSWRKEKRTERT